MGNRIVKMIKPYTHDKFLGGKLIFKQCADGFRSGSDGVLLAGSLPQDTKGRILDVGCGTGVVGLCAAYRLPLTEVIGIDCLQEVINLAQENAKTNGLENRVTFIVDNILNPTKMLAPNSFEHVVSNPPYFKDSTPSPDVNRAIGRSYDDTTLQAWVDYCIKMAKPRGFIHFIFPTDGLQTLLDCLGAQVGGLNLYPLWPNAEALTSKRIIVTVRRDVKSPTILHKGLVLHEADGRYTDEASRILWDGV